VVILRRALAVLLAALVLVEAGGAARAIAAAGDVRCCCGAHSFARPCRCRSCPAARRRATVDDAHAEHAHEQAAAPLLAPDGHCQLGSDADALVPLVLFPAPPLLAPVATVEVAHPTPPFSPPDRHPDPLRPPP